MRPEDLQKFIHPISKGDADYVKGNRFYHPRQLSEMPGVRLWLQSIGTNTPASSGTVMLAALPVVLGFQLLLEALRFDTMNIPAKPLSLEKIL